MNANFKNATNNNKGKGNKMNIQRDYKIESSMDKVNAHEDSKMFLEPTMSHTKNANKP